MPAYGLGGGGQGPPRPGAGRHRQARAVEAEPRTRRRLERVQVAGVHLADPDRGPGGAVEHEQRPVAAGLVGRGHPHGVAEVARAVGVGVVEGPLGAGDHDGLVAGVQQVEQEDGLLHRVGAVGDHDPVRAALELVEDQQRHLGDLVEREREAGAGAVVQGRDRDVGRQPGEVGARQQPGGRHPRHHGSLDRLAGDGAAGADEDDPARGGHGVVVPPRPVTRQWAMSTKRE